MGMVAGVVAAALPWADAAAQTAPDVPRLRVEVASQADSVVLVGDLYLPPAGSRGAPWPGIILLGVTGPNDRSLTFGQLAPFEALARHLAAAGMAVLSLDDRGVGESGGDWATIGHEVLVADALSALQALADRPDVDSARLGIFGLSEGSGIAMMAAAREPGRVGFLILGSPPGLAGEAALAAQFETSLRLAGVTGQAAEPWRARYGEFVGLVRAGDIAPLQTFLSGPGAMLVPPYAFVPRDPAARAALFAGPWYQSQLSYDPAGFLPSVVAPTMVIGGTLDPILPPALHHPPIQAAIGSANVEVHVLPGLNHLLLPAVTGLPTEYAQIAESADARVLRLITDWLKRQQFLD